MQEVVGSSPIGSTFKARRQKRRRVFRWFFVSGDSKRLFLSGVEGPIADPLEA